jgi:von Willebrand factor type A domain
VGSTLVSPRATCMSNPAKLALPITILFGLISSGFAQGTVDLPKETRSIVVNVFDARGDAIRDLTKESFRVHLNGKPVAVLDAQYSVAARRIVVLLDISGSMRGEFSTAKWTITREAVGELLAEVPPDVPIAMLTFAGEVHNAFDFSHSRTDIAKWLEGVPSQGPSLKSTAKTALFDAILEGLRLLGTIRPGDAIYAVTDGGENASRASRAQTKAALLQSTVRLFAFLLAESSVVFHERVGEDSFLEMVDDSGGVCFAIAGRHRPDAASWNEDFLFNKDAREKIRSSTHDVNIEVSEFWTLQLAAPTSDKEDNIKLNVLGPNGKIRKDVKLIYPRLLPPSM